MKACSASFTLKTSDTINAPKNGRIFLRMRRRIGKGTCVPRHVPTFSVTYRISQHALREWLCANPLPPSVSTSGKPETLVRPMTTSLAHSFFSIYIAEKCSGSVLRVKQTKLERRPLETQIVLALDKLEKGTRKRDQYLLYILQ